MQEHQVDSLPVTEEGCLLGVITQGTLERYLPSYVPHAAPSSWQIGQAMTQTAVRDVMNLNPMTISPDTPIQKAADIMLKEEVDTIPVTDGDDILLGVISLQDILHMVAQS